jgi:hypothetical protein
MKLLLVSADDETFSKLFSLTSAGFDLIRYRNALKAMDNIDEIAPDGIIISAQDFPRHWKTVAQFVRAGRSKSECPIALLRGGTFPDDERDKAEYIGINGAVNETLNEKDCALLRRFLEQGIRAEQRPATAAPEARTETKIPGRSGFMFTNPVSEKIITGEVTDLTGGGLSMEVDRPVLINNLKAGAEIPGCSLRAGDAILSPSCVIRKTTYGGVISLNFSSFPGSEEAALKTWLAHGAG